ncbi:MAG: hypothetical protein RSE41_07090 [Clostridia bacterium]
MKVESPGNNNHQVIYLNDIEGYVVKFKLKKGENAGIIGNRIELWHNNYDKVYAEAYYLLKIIVDENVNIQ